MEYALAARNRCPSPSTWYADQYLHTALVLGLFFYSVTAMCPAQCFCRDDTLQASCVNASLEVVPIQLNPDVQNITLRDNKIDNVDYTLTFYINLLYLDVSANKIQTLGNHNFEVQTHLLLLNISYNQVTVLGKGTFKGLKLLQKLDLSNNSIELIEAGAFKDTRELVSLDLSNNKITSFANPNIFMSLKNLKILSLEGNQIIDVPSEVFKQLPYSSLEILKLSNNFIDVLEDLSFPAPMMGSLQMLTLASNAISSVHKSTFNTLHSLTYLDLSDNNLTSVPTEQLSKLSQLTELDLSENMFCNIKSVAFQSLFHLKILKLCRMPHLTRIDSRAFVDNIRLETVILDDNREMKALPARVFHGNHHLLYVSIRRNSIQTVDASHFPVDHLQSLDISENPFNCNCSLLWLWRLAVREHYLPDSTLFPSNGSYNREEITKLKLNIEDLTCDLPDTLRGKLLVDVPESVVLCETTWLTVAAVTAFVLALFVATCVVLLLISTDKSLFTCKRAKDPTDPSLNSGSKRLATNLHNSGGPPPVLMLMPEEYSSDYLKGRQKRDLRYMEPWVPVKAEQVNQIHNDYALDVTNSIRKPPHIVYV